MRARPRSLNSGKPCTMDLMDPFGVLADPATGTVEHDRRPNQDWEFQALVDNASVGIALESVEGEIFYVNPAFCRMLGYEQDELRGMRCSEFTYDEDEKTEMILFAELREGRRTGYQVDKRFRHKNDELVWARVSISLLKTGTAGPPLIVGIVEDIKERRVAEEEVKKSKLELQQLAGHLLQAQEEERLRISMELHDDIGQRMMLMNLELAKLEQELRASDEPTLAEKAADLNAGLKELESSIHDMCSNLHSSKLDFLGLRAALHELCNNIYRHSGIVVRLEVDEDAGRLPKEVALCLYRVAQEAINNISKHSGARHAEVLVRREGDFVRLTIRDFGKGFDVPILGETRGIGLASMRERLRSVGGTFGIHSLCGAGTEVTAEVNCVSACAAEVSGGG